MLLDLQVFFTTKDIFVYFQLPPEIDQGKYNKNTHIIETGTLEIELVA